MNTVDVIVQEQQHSKGCCCAASEVSEPNHLGGLVAISRLAYSSSLCTLKAPPKP